MDSNQINIVQILSIKIKPFDGQTDVYDFLEKFEATNFDTSQNRLAGLRQASLMLTFWTQKKEEKF